MTTHQKYQERIAGIFDTLLDLSGRVGKYNSSEAKAALCTLMAEVEREGRLDELERLGEYDTEWIAVKARERIAELSTKRPESAGGTDE